MRARSLVFWKDPKARVYHVHLSVPLSLSGLQFPHLSDRWLASPMPSF